jgi:hypothetical protein
VGTRKLAIQCTACGKPHCGLHKTGSFHCRFCRQSESGENGLCFRQFRNESKVVAAVRLYRRSVDFGRWCCQIDLCQSSCFRSVRGIIGCQNTTLGNPLLDLPSSTGAVSVGCLEQLQQSGYRVISYELGDKYHTILFDPQRRCIFDEAGNLLQVGFKRFFFALYRVGRLNDRYPILIAVLSLPHRVMARYLRKRYPFTPVKAYQRLYRSRRIYRPGDGRFPELVDKRRHASPVEIASGRLVILNIGIADREGNFHFGFARRSRVGVRSTEPMHCATVASLQMREMSSYLGAAIVQRCCQEPPLGRL